MEKNEIIDIFISEIKREFPDQNWNYLEFIKTRLLGNNKFTTPSEVVDGSLEEIADELYGEFSSYADNNASIIGMNRFQFTLALEQFAKQNQPKQAVVVSDEIIKAKLVALNYDHVIQDFAFEDGAKWMQETLSQQPKPKTSDENGINVEKEAKSIYMSMTSFANYSEMNGISRDWFLTCIQNGLIKFAQQQQPKSEAVDELDERFNSDVFIDNVCLSYRHDFGLMAKQDKQKLRFECKEWIRGIRNNWIFFTQSKKQ